MEQIESSKIGRNLRKIRKKARLSSEDIAKVEGIIAFLQAYAGVKSDRQLAFWLGITAQAIPNWKVKGDVPKYVHVLVRELRKMQRMKKGQSGHFDFYLKDGTARRFDRKAGTLEQFDEQAKQWRKV
jgi:transcriptional regulator with XRE-family HTH domain